MSATSPGQSDSASRAVVVDRTLGHLVVFPRAFSPNRDGRLDSTAIRFQLASDATVRVRILRRRALIRTLSSGPFAAGLQSFSWGGRDPAGARVPDGTYTARIEATTSLGTRTLGQRVVVDTTRPRVKVISAVARRMTKIRLSLTEPAHVTLWFGPVTWRGGGSISADLPAGTSAIFRRRRLGGVRVVARDAAGNRSFAVTAKVARR